MELDVNNIFTEYPNVVNVSQLQKMLGLGRSKAIELLKSGEINSIRIGRTYKIPKVFVIDYLNSKGN